MVKTELLLGDEAIALAALHANIGGAFSYPGTPATEIFEFIEGYAHRTGDIAARGPPTRKWPTKRPSACRTPAGGPSSR